VKTTLLEGSVKVSAGGKTGFLKPFQEAQVGEDGNIIVKEVVKTDVPLWTRKTVRVDQDDLMPVLHELCRWYNVELEITPEAKKIELTSSISGSHSLDNSLESILDEINKTTQHAHFELKGRKIQVTVKPSGK